MGAELRRSPQARRPLPWRRRATRPPSATADALERCSTVSSRSKRSGSSSVSRTSPALCEALGHPERSFVSLHVAGTNGKGSVTAMVHAALRAGGLRAARYTSPHLADLTERFVDRRPRRSDAATLRRGGRDVLDLADRLVRTGALRVTPTFFEATTAIAFELFRRAGRRGGGHRGGTGRPVRRHQRHHTRGRRHHDDRLRPPAAPRPHARRDRVREGRHHQARNDRSSPGELPPEAMTSSAASPPSGAPR